MSNKANVVGAAVPQITTDGPCLIGTVEALKTGVGARPMGDEALAKVRTDAFGLLEKVVRVYARDVAAGEVGAGGTARASAKPPTARSPTGLLYGRVQSGKTVAMIALSAAALDNGFKVIVVLTSDNVKLVDQTAERFTALYGALVRESNTAEGWDADAEHIKKHIAENGVVFICTKNQQRLTVLVDFLGKIGAADYPALVLDDEADQATLDTTAQARKSGRIGSGERSAIHKKTVMDPTGGQSIRQTLRHHVFLQVTATPYALLLQNIDSELRPVFTHLLEPGKGYTGGEAFFDAKIVETDAPPLVIVDEDESEELENQTEGPPPEGLQHAIAFFLVGSAAQWIADPASRGGGQNFLCHTSQKTMEHDRLAGLIRGYLNSISDELRAGGPSATVMRLQSGYDELKKTLPNPPSLDEITSRIKQRLPQREIVVINSASAGVLSKRLNFVVGGNILGRGLTIENLLVTYYLRRAKISQMDTVLQHARMYGYRELLMPYTRVFLPADLSSRFHFIHTAEQNLRRQLVNEDALSRIIVETMANLRATRLNVLDTSNLTAYEGGQHVYPQRPFIEKNAKKMRERMQAVESELKKFSSDPLPLKKNGKGDLFEVSPNDFFHLLRIMPVRDEDADFWDVEMFIKMLSRASPKWNWKKGYLFIRSMNRTKLTMPTGALSGTELTNLRKQAGPVLACFRDDWSDFPDAPKNEPFWYPSLVLPSKMPTQVFNLSAE